RELVGRCMAVYPEMEKVTYSGFCIRYRIADASLQATYVAHLFRSVAFRRVIFQGGQGANIQNINQQTLSKLPIPIPDEGLQSQFADIVEKIEAQKQIMRRAAEKSDAFFASLQQLAFSGKL
ncbi:restriction endonuclease subunit S, partial [Achromobacter marplatensis]|uniref:restriction endonuclease subunit S n=1 Tax=Achromobacter marplatensis TaxID=470868 RepID=UPI000277FA06